MRLESLDLEELYSLKDKVSYNIHLKKHDAKPVSEAIVYSLVSLWNSGRSCKLEQGSLRFVFRDTEFCLRVWSVQYKPVFFIMLESKPVFFNGIKHWPFTESGIIQALHCLGEIYDKLPIAQPD